MIISPRLRDGDTTAHVGWALLLFYLLATTGSFLFSTSPNFTDEYRGALWALALLAESMALLFATGMAAHTLTASDKLRAKGTYGLFYCSLSGLKWTCCGQFEQGNWPPQWSTKERYCRGVERLITLECGQSLATTTNYPGNPNTLLCFSNSQPQTAYKLKQTNKQTMA